MSLLFVAPLKTTQRPMKTQKRAEMDWTGLPVLIFQLCHWSSQFLRTARGFVTSTFNTTNFKFRRILLLIFSLSWIIKQSASFNISHKNFSLIQVKKDYVLPFTITHQKMQVFSSHL